MGEGTRSPAERGAAERKLRDRVWSWDIERMHEARLSGEEKLAELGMRWRVKFTRDDAGDNNSGYKAGRTTPLSFRTCNRGALMSRIRLGRTKSVVCDSSSRRSSIGAGPAIAPVNFLSVDAGALSTISCARWRCCRAKSTPSISENFHIWP
jgi:hypothetical protein